MRVPWIAGLALRIFGEKDMDTYQPIYDAVCTRIGHPDVTGAIERVARQAFDISGQMACLYGDASLAVEHWAEAGRQHQRPFMLLRPKMYPDGDQWCALYGDDLQEGVAGFGETPERAAVAFDLAWLNSRANYK